MILFLGSFWRISHWWLLVAWYWLWKLCLSLLLQRCARSLQVWVCFSLGQDQNHIWRSGKPWFGQIVLSYWNHPPSGEQYLVLGSVFNKVSFGCLYVQGTEYVMYAKIDTQDDNQKLQNWFFFNNIFLNVAFCSER